ncbi:MAG: hypothetical protein ORN28_02575 [Rhodoferax sp.]|nr:hypothetical protein [Rhodoferax sp.]
MDIYERSKAAINQARAKALVSVREKGFPTSVQIDPSKFNVLGEEWSKRGANLHASILGDAPMVAGSMLAVTMRLRWFTVYVGAYYCEWLGSDPSVYAPIPPGYADDGKGWVSTLSELLEISA